MRTWRINPFVMPSEITIRLILIVFNSVGIWAISIVCYSIVPGLITRKLTEWKWYLLFLMIAGITTNVLSLAFIVYGYFSASSRIIKKYALQPLSLKYPSLENEITGIAREMGIKGRVTPLLQEGNGWYPLVFGVSRRAYILLPEGLLQFYAGRNINLVPIIAHELAHVRNGDVWQILLSQLLTRAMAFPILWEILLIVNFHFIPEMESLLTFYQYLLLFQSMSVVAMAVSVNSMQRYRELYADARAASFTKSAEKIYEAIARFEIASAHRKQEDMPSEMGLKWSMAIPKWVGSFYPLPHARLEERRQHLLGNWQLFSAPGMDFFALGNLTSFGIWWAFFILTIFSAYTAALQGQDTDPVVKSAISGYFTGSFFLWLVVGYLFFSYKIVLLRLVSLYSQIKALDVFTGIVRSTSMWSVGFATPLIFLVTLVTAFNPDTFPDGKFLLQLSTFSITMIVLLILAWIIMTIVEIGLSELFVSVSMAPIFRMVNPAWLCIYLPKLLILMFFIIISSSVANIIAPGIRDKILPPLCGIPMCLTWIFSLIFPVIKMVASSRAYCRYCKTTYKMGLIKFFSRFLFRPSQVVCPSCGHAIVVGKVKNKASSLRIRP